MNKEVIETFRKQAIAFIKWSNKGSGVDFSDDIAAIRKAKTFKEIEIILAPHDDGTFLDFTLNS